MNGDSKNGFWRRAGLDAVTGWLMGMAAVILSAIAMCDVAEAMAEGAGGVAAGLLWVASDLSLVAAVVAAVATVPVLGHNFFGAGYSGDSLGRMSSRWAPRGLAVAGSLMAVSAVCLLVGFALPS